MPATIRARSRPYAPVLRANQRICKRCGIRFTVNGGKRDKHITQCIDCRYIH